MRKITKDFWASVNSLAWFALCLVVVAVHPGRALADAGLLHRVSLLPGVQGQMWSDGTVRFQAGASDRSTLVLQLQSIDLADPQRAAEPGPVFTGVYTEGTVGGQRGLANDADDDGDGVTDEDRADGRDNDGDGLIDEDFAAIGEVMTVVSSEDRHGNQHLETYHWSYPHLQSTILIASRHEASDSVRQPAVSITASGGQIWKSADRSWRLHGRAGAAALPRAPIFVTSLPDPSGSGEQLWLGLSRLDRLQGRSSVPGRARHEGSRIEIPLREGACDLALTVARTYLQLLANLEAAQGVHLGARNRGSSDRIPWVVPPLCPACLSDEIPAVSLRQLGSESWSLVFRVEPRQNVLFDPERFRIGEVSLGPPVRIHWRGWAVGRPAAPDDRSTPPRERWSVAWTSPSLDDLDRLDLQELNPYEASQALRAHTATGELTFEFSGTVPAAAPGSSGQLQGFNLYGRSFSIPLPELAAEAQQSAGDEGSLAASDLRSELQRGGSVPSLAPSLLDNFPNPFSEQTRIRYKIPATIGEGFVWNSEDAPSIDPQKAIPYRSGQPTVNLKVYSLGGQEIITLFSGSLPIGEYEAMWEGADAAGRKVASGTYFCKLQIENWSVTQRLVYLR